MSVLLTLKYGQYLISKVGVAVVGVIDKDGETVGAVGITVGAKDGASETVGAAVGVYAYTPESVTPELAPSTRIVPLQLPKEKHPSYKVNCEQVVESPGKPRSKRNKTQLVPNITWHNVLQSRTNTTIIIVGGDFHFVASFQADDLIPRTTAASCKIINVRNDKQRLKCVCISDLKSQVSNLRMH
jgi:hypothetical protein